MSRKRVAVLISGTGSNMLRLVDAAHQATFPAEISLVLSNKTDAGGLRLAEAAGIPAKARQWVRRDQQTAFEEWAMAELAAARIDLICCAGFMRILSGHFVRRFKDRILNIHPSLLPAFPGLHTHQRALDAGARFAGCTVHLMREEVDTGPIIAQAVTRILPHDTAETIASRVLLLEHQIYPTALELVAGDKVTVSGNRVRVTDQKDPSIEGHLVDPVTKFSRLKPSVFPPDNQSEVLALSPPLAQKMPRSLGLTLRAMRVMAGLTTEEMATQLNSNIGRFNPTKMQFSKQSLSLLELAQTGTQNWHLEAFQNWSCVPTSCIDLIAHLGADLRNNDIESARGLAHTVQRLCETVELRAAELRDKASNAAHDDESAADYNRFKEACSDGSRAKAKKGAAIVSVEQQETDLLMLLLAQQLIEIFNFHQKRPLRKIKVGGGASGTSRKRRKDK